ncbi:cytochrome P450 2B4-like [Uloborus diversus]|uniref:cytochrome P450 2B4-like n=1 Tax=Uloborus diversus TaxID=327109 RepID=UPI0024094461|nr:cytochrome P450 2B4-like [Uloborus diversus]
MLKNIEEILFALSPLHVSIIVVLFTIIYYVLKNRNLPPGPVGVPYLGMWPFLGHYTGHIKLDEMKKKYGDVFSFTVTGQLYINLGTVKVLREAHVSKSDCFTLRPVVFSLMKHAFDGGLPYLNGEPWKVMRKFFVQTFKEYGLTVQKEATAGSLYDHLNSTVETLRTSSDASIGVIEFFTERIMNIMHGLVLNNDALTKEDYREFIKHYVTLFENMSPIDNLMTGFFAKRIIIPLRPAYTKSVAGMETLTYRMIDRRESTFDPSNVRDIIDYFLTERNERRSKGDPTAEHFTRKVLMATLLQIMGDGVLGVTHLIATFVYLTASYPEEQEKVYKELIDVIGHNRQPALEDKSKLPYTNAFIYEVLRMSNIFPIFPSLECTKDTTINGYRIPKGAITLMNAYSSHKDPESYESPDEFRPSRFIATPDKPRADLPITFGAGKRACAGEGFALTQAFMFLVTIVKNFEVSLPEDAAPISDPMEMRVVFKERIQQQ